MTATINASTSSGVVTTADNSGVLQLQTASTAALTIDGSQNVGIGTASPSKKLQVNSTDGTISVFKTTSGANNSVLNIDISDATATAGFSVGGNSTFPALTFANGGSERMRIDSSGNLLVGTTATNVTSGGYNFLINDGGTGYSTGYIGHSTGCPSGYAYLNFKYAGTSIGTITQNGTTAVAYNTSSDYRLKHDIAPMTGALAKVAALKPVTYKWNADNSDGEGFIAHELAEVCPHAVTGAKDAVDAEGNPVYQGIDTSFLVATLTAAIQEQQALIQTLTDRITALEGK